MDQWIYTACRMGEAGITSGYQTYARSKGVTNSEVAELERVTAFLLSEEDPDRNTFGIYQLSSGKGRWCIFNTSQEAKDDLNRLAFLTHAFLFDEPPKAPYAYFDSPDFRKSLTSAEVRSSEVPDSLEQRSVSELRFGGELVTGESPRLWVAELVKNNQDTARHLLQLCLDEDSSIMVVEENEGSSIGSVLLFGLCWEVSPTWGERSKLSLNTVVVEHNSTAFRIGGWPRRFGRPKRSFARRFGNVVTWRELSDEKKAETKLLSSTSRRFAGLIGRKSWKEGKAPAKKKEEVITAPEYPMARELKDFEAHEGRAEALALIELSNNKGSERPNIGAEEMGQFLFRLWYTGCSEYSQLFQLERNEVKEFFLQHYSQFLHERFESDCFLEILREKGKEEFAKAIHSEFRPAFSLELSQRVESLLLEKTKRSSLLCLHLSLARLTWRQKAWSVGSGWCNAIVGLVEQGDSAEDTLGDRAFDLWSTYLSSEEKKQVSELLPKPFASAEPSEVPEKNEGGTTSPSAERPEDLEGIAPSSSSESDSTDKDLSKVIGNVKNGTARTQSEGGKRSKETFAATTQRSVPMQGAKADPGEDDEKSVEDDKSEEDNGEEEEEQSVLDARYSGPDVDESADLESNSETLESMASVASEEMKPKRSGGYIIFSILIAVFAGGCFVYFTSDRRGGAKGAASASSKNGGEISKPPSTGGVVESSEETVATKKEEKASVAVEDKKKNETEITAAKTSETETGKPVGSGSGAGGSSGSLPVEAKVESKPIGGPEKTAAASPVPAGVNVYDLLAEEKRTFQDLLKEKNFNGATQKLNEMRDRGIPEWNEPLKGLSIEQGKAIDNHNRDWGLTEPQLKKLRASFDASISDRNFESAKKLADRISALAGEFPDKEAAIAPYAKIGGKSLLEFAGGEIESAAARDKVFGEKLAVAKDLFLKGKYPETDKAIVELESLRKGVSQDHGTGLDGLRKDLEIQKGAVAIKKKKDDEEKRAADMKVAAAKKAEEDAAAKVKKNNEAEEKKEAQRKKDLLGQCQKISKLITSGSKDVDKEMAAWKKSESYSGNHERLLGDLKAVVTHCGAGDYMRALAVAKARHLDEKDPAASAIVKSLQDFVAKKVGKDLLELGEPFSFEDLEIKDAPNHIGPSAELKVVQTNLAQDEKIAEKKFSVGTDGKRGPNTQNALLLYQHLHGKKITGKIEKELRKPIEPEVKN